MEPDEPLYSVPHLIQIVRTSRPACRVLAAVLVLTAIGLEYVETLWNLPHPVALVAAYNPAIWTGETWRLLVSPFVHDGGPHLIIVVFNLLLFGPVVEDLLGTPRFVLLCLWAAAVSQLTSLALGSSPTCGASPIDMAIFGTLGVALTLRYSDFEATVSGTLALLVLTAVVLVGALPSTDLEINAASHLGGLLAGIMMAPILLPLPWPLPTGARGIMIACTLVMITGLMMVAIIPHPTEIAQDLEDRAIAEYQDDAYATARTHLEDALALTPDEAFPAFALGAVSYQQGRPDEAEKWFRQAVMNDPDLTDGWEKLAQLAIEQGQIEKARAWLRVEARLLPENPEVPLLLGQAWLQQGDLPHAVACYRQALELKGADPDAHRQLADVDLQQGELAQAREELKGAGDDVDTTILRADLALVEGHGAADTDVRKLLERHDAPVQACLWDGRFEEEAQDEEAARRAYRMAREVAPEDADVLMALGDLWREQGIGGGARHCYDLVLRQPMRSEAERLQHGLAALGEGDLPQATRLIEPARRRSPHRPVALEANARLQEATGNYAAARTDWAALVTDSPWDGDLWFEVGWCALHLHNVAEASACFDRAVHLAHQPWSEELARGYLAFVQDRPAEALQRANGLLANRPHNLHARELSMLGKGPDRSN